MSGGEDGQLAGLLDRPLEILMARQGVDINPLAALAGIQYLDASNRAVSVVIQRAPSTPADCTRSATSTGSSRSRLARRTESAS
jgi:hypothetical protein